MKDIKVVIGSSFGDESKGKMVDYFASEYGPDALVIRFNSGAQAGHSVQTDKTRHVFSHFGSGTLVNSPTYLSRFFVCHPHFFKKELLELVDKSILPKIYVSPNCLVTTPFDMMINRFIEKYRESRGDIVHGSVGIGFNETIQRSTNTGNYGLIVSDLNNTDKLYAILKRIVEEYVPLRYGELTGVEFSGVFPDTQSYMIDKFIEECKYFYDCVEISIADNIMDNYKNWIFEGAQGLGLDQDYGRDRGYFPHVTHSNTGLKNVVSILNWFDYDCPVDVIYVTRPYITRHGAGPLSHELPDKPYENIIDLTNVPNDFQGTIRYAWLDINELQDRIDYDWQYAKNLDNPKMHLAISCVDQISDFSKNPIVKEGKLIEAGFILQPYLNPNKIYISNGPTRKNIEVC